MSVQTLLMQAPPSWMLPVIHGITSNSYTLDGNKQVKVAPFDVPTLLGLGFYPTGTGAAPLESLNDVLVTTPANNDVLTWDSTAKLWKNKAGGGGGLSNPFADSALALWASDTTSGFGFDGAGQPTLVQSSGGLTAVLAVNADGEFDPGFLVGPSPGTSGVADIVVAAYGASLPALVLNTAGGVSGSPTFTTNGTAMGGITVQGFDGSNWVVSATLHFSAVEDFSSSPTARGTTMSINTVDTITETGLGRIIIDGSGNTNIQNGALVLGNTGITVAGTPGMMVGTDATSGFGFDGSGLPLLIDTPDNVTLGFTSGEPILGIAGLIIGGANSYFGLAIENTVVDSSGGANISMVSYGAGTTPEIDFSLSRGVVGTPAPVVNADALGVVQFRGYDTVGSSNGAQFQVIAQETFSPTAHGVSFEIDTTKIGSTSTLARILIDGSGNTNIQNGSLIVGTGALATTATDGFTYIATTAGTPTGTPTAHTGTVPMVYDTTNHQFWFYDGGGWKQPKTPAGAATVTWQ